MTKNPLKESMTDLIAQSLAHFAAHHGDPYAPAYEALYAHDATYEGLFLLDTDEGLRRNMMHTTLKILPPIYPTAKPPPIALSEPV